jgi:hypothetical protein
MRTSLCADGSNAATWSEVRLAGVLAEGAILTSGLPSAVSLMVSLGDCPTNWART